VRERQERQAIARIDNCQRIQIEKLLYGQFGLKQAQPEINFGDLWQSWQFWQSEIKADFYGN